MNLSTVQKMIEDRLTVANLDNLSVKITNFKLFYRSVPEDVTIKSIIAQLKIIVHNLIFISNLVIILNMLTIGHS